MRQEPLCLRCEALGSDVRVAWNSSVPPIASATNGLLRIREDGRETTISLTGDQLRSGGYVYARTSDANSVRVRLEVSDGEAHRTGEDLSAELPPRLAAGTAPPQDAAQDAAGGQH